MIAALTGGTGFLGRAVAARLLRDGWQVRRLVRNPHDGAPDHVVGSLEDEESLARLVDGAALVVHVAGLVQARDARQFHAINVEGAKRLGRAIRHHAAQARLVAVSSLAAREPGLSPYAASKAAGEAALLEHSGSDDWVVLRPCALYGPGDRATLAMFRAALLPILPLPARPDARLALLHVDDAAAAVAAAARAPHRGRLWEVGAGAFAWAAIGRAAAAALGRNPALLPVPRPVLAAGLALLRLLAPGASPLASPGKLAEMLHHDWTCRFDHLPPGGVWTPTIGLEDGFSATAAWYRLHGWL
jgi:nucleoside-diphosphate-sugar epimerase